jgi:uncharacterized alkaline shock family protein YloU
MEEKETTDLGEIRIANEVIAIVARIAATEIKGVVGMSEGVIKDGIAKILRGDSTKGVKVELGEKEAVINLSVVVEYGVRIPEVGWEIQKKVKQSVEAMTGLDIKGVNVNIQGVHLPSLKNEVEKEETK